MSVSENCWFVAAPWGRLAVVAWGDCRSPPALLCHGKQDSAATFRPLVRLLPQTYYYISFDLPGNSRSDPLPPGLPLGVHDLMFSIRTLVSHFRWERFTFVGHSLGALLGMHYNLMYPGRMERAVLLDPVPAYQVWELDDLSKWYYKFYMRYFEGDAYGKYNAGRETAPTYTYENALQTVQRNRGLTAAAAAHAVERILEPTGDGHYRFTFDQRMKLVTPPPYPLAYLEHIYTSVTMPILNILAEDSIARGSYKRTPFIFEAHKYRRGNYRVVRVEGNHDVHLNHPERLAPLLAEFLDGGVAHTATAKL